MRRYDIFRRTARLKCRTGAVGQWLFPVLVFLVIYCFAIGYRSAETSYDSLARLVILGTCVAAIHSASENLSFSAAANIALALACLQLVVSRNWEMMPFVGVAMHAKSHTTRIIAKTSPHVVLNGPILSLKGNLQRADFGVFEQGCKILAKSPECKVVLDLTACTYVSSLAIGILVDAVTQMNADGKDVKVRVSPEVGRFLHMAHLYHLFNYEIVDTSIAPG